MTDQTLRILAFTDDLKMINLVIGVAGFSSSFPSPYRSRCGVNLDHFKLWRQTSSKLSRNKLFLNCSQAAVLYSPEPALYIAPEAWCIEFKKWAGHASGLIAPERPLHSTPSPSAEPAVATRTQGIGVCSPEVVGDLLQPRGPLYWPAQAKRAFDSHKNGGPEKGRFHVHNVSQWSLTYS